MKQGKKPTREQRKLMEKYKLNPADWLVCKDTSTQMIISYKHIDNQYKTINK